MARPRAYELCSVDVWDTLLRRACHPNAVKLHVARELLDRAFDAVAAPLREPRALLKLRSEVEACQAAAARKAGYDDEYGHEDVLAQWLARATPELAARERTALVKGLVEEEWRQEERVAYADPGIDAVLDGIQARRWVFVSDFYMSAERLFALLHSKGLAARFADGFSSCDMKLNKRSGRLFRRIHAQLHVAPAQHVHVGDRESADVRVPRQLGMAAIHYRPTRAERDRRLGDRGLEDRRALFRTLEQHCAALEPPEAVAETWRYGVTLAPLFAGFAQFVAERARRERVQRLLFCTREGAFFARVHTALAPAGPEAELFEVSRDTTFAASLGAATREDMQRLWRAFPRQTVAAWGGSLGLEAARLAECCTRLGLSLEAPAAEVRLLDDAQVRRLVDECVARRRGELEAYLRSRTLPEEGRIGLVDIGWRGSILDNLARMRPRLEWRGYYLGLQEFLEPQSAGTLKAAFGPDLNRSKDGAKLFRNLPLLELVCLSPGGSVAGYRHTADGRVEAQRRADGEEDAAYADTIRHLQDGVLAGVAVWAEAIRTQALGADELRSPALKVWGKLVAAPPRFLRERLARHPHDERFGRGRFAPVGPPQGRLARWLRRAGAGRAATTKA